MRPDTGQAAFRRWGMRRKPRGVVLGDGARFVSIGPVAKSVVDDLKRD